MEVKKVVATRIKPGDRWGLVTNIDGDLEVRETLTDMLELIFSRYKITQFFIDAKQGEISLVEILEDEVIVEDDIKTWSLYGEH